MFIEIDDYKTVCSPRELDVLTRSDSQVLRQAERVALAEIASCLDARYDTALAFAARGDQRNPHLVQLAVNIVLYYLSQSLPGKMGGGNRACLYDRSIAWLDAARTGERTPQLPLRTPEPEQPETPVA